MNHKVLSRVFFVIALWLLGACSEVTKPDPVDLSTEATTSQWVARLKFAVQNPPSNFDPDDWAASKDTYQIGRNLNEHVTNLITAYRVTGDRFFISEVNRLMQIARGTLADYNDQYANWLWYGGTGSYSNCIAKPDNKPFCGKDNHNMDEMMSHSLVAAAAYALEQAGGFDSNVAFWTNYIRYDFVPKWRGYSQNPTGMPFMDYQTLTHPMVQFIRFNYYTYKLTGDTAYSGEASSLTDRFRASLRRVTSPNGPAYIWPHNLVSTRPGGNTCQNSTYIRYTMQAMQDLATQNFNVFSDDVFMGYVANAFANFVITNPSTLAFESDICGGKVLQDQLGRGNLQPDSDASNLTYNLFAHYPYSAIGKWDSSGRVRTATENAFERDVFVSKPEKPQFPNLSAQMLWLQN